MLGQQATEEKSNEITAIPLLLKHLDLKGALVTMDAMGTQTDIARAIRDGGGDYCMSLKKDWPSVYADVEQLFNDPPDNVAFETEETVDLTGGRIETRRHTVCHKVDWITSDRHYPGEPRFRTGDGPQNMAIIRHTTLNLLSRAKPTVSLKNRRKRAGWNVDYLEAVIRQTA